MERPFETTIYNINGKLTIMNGPQLGFLADFRRPAAKKATVLVQTTPASGRDHVHDAVSPPFEFVQEGGKHLGGLRLGVVEQHDSAADLLDTGEDQAQLLVRAHRQPVAGPDVGAEHDDAALAHAVEQRAIRGKAGKAEERRDRIGAALAVDRVFVFLDAVIDLGFRLGERHVVEQRVRIGVMADAVGFGQRAPGVLRIRFGVLAEQEECGTDAFVLEGGQYFRGGAGPGTVVEGEHQFLALKRHGRWEVLAADPRRALGVDLDHPLGAERLRIARARLRRGGQRSKDRGNRKSNDATHLSALGPQLTAMADARQASLDDRVYALIVCPAAAAGRTNAANNPVRRRGPACSITKTARRRCAMMMARSAPISSYRSRRRSMPPTLPRCAAWSATCTNPISAPCWKRWSLPAARAWSNCSASTSTSPRSPRWTMRCATKFSKSCRRRRWRKACATSNPTTRSRSSRICRRKIAPRSSTSCRRRSGSRLPAASITPRTPPAGACRPSSSPCRRIWDVGHAIDYMRETAELPEQFYEVYVVDEGGRFLGAVTLDRLLRSKRLVPISELMEAERRRVRADQDKEEVARLFQRYDL